MSTSPELILLPSLMAHKDQHGTLFLTQKYLDGVAEFEKLWPGPVTTLCHVDSRPSLEMDLVPVKLNQDEPRLEERPTELGTLEDRLKGVAAVLAHLAPQEASTAQLCHTLGVPIVFTSEYTPKTEAQIVDASTSNRMMRIRRKLWIKNTEKTRIGMLRNHAAGLQCSGTPTYDHYRHVMPDALLFFDNRVRRSHVISDDGLAEKAAVVTQGKSLRLVFGGRFVAMKGVMDLPKVAAALRQLGVPFTLDIVGSGPLEADLREAVAALDDPNVRVHPPMDFKTGWVPFLRDTADLFVCCHPQGDPSSTYPEVMSCGVPVVGYDNEAWAGVLRKSNAGWSVPMGDHAALAREVAALNVNRGEIVSAASRSRDFALKHCFEETEIERVSHIMQLALPKTSPA